MTNGIRYIRSAWVVLWATLALLGSGPVAAAESHLDEDVRAALKTLYESAPAASALGAKAKGILVFPNIVKAGFIVGGQGGDGALLKNGKRVAYYNSAAVSVGLQAGAQSFAFAIFFMSDAVMKSFESSTGFEIGVGPSVVIVDAGAARDINTLTAKSDVYAFVFGQKGLMAGVGLQGTKITKINR
jgi:lipid-binding SYLF domain-containing protein